MTITIIGTGFVGVVTSAVYASFGHRVFGLDIDQKKIDTLRKSEVPFHEPQLEELLKRTQEKGQLLFTTDYGEAIPGSDIVMIAVGTPAAADGGVDLRFVLATARSMAPHLKANALVVVKSTVPPGTLAKVRAEIAKLTDVKFQLAALPEFLKEGTAVEDTLHPDRIVIGAESQAAFALLEELHQPLDTPVVKISPESAQMAKYTANAYLATRITFINQVADLCEKTGADVEEVIKAIGYDKRIGAHYWYPGPGYGGSCFPKDVKELAHLSKMAGEGDNLFVKIDQLNADRIERLIQKYGQKVGGFAGKKVAILGLSFKPNTDDLREAPSTKFIPALIAAGAEIRAFDPVAGPVAQSVFQSSIQSGKLTIVDSIEQALADADVILLLTEWPEFVSYDYDGARIKDKEQWFFDTRNRLDPKKLKQAGFHYSAIGRGFHTSSSNLEDHHE